jgi:hypothetical protein
MPDFSQLSTPEIIMRLRKCASIWFKNDDLLLLEELIRRTTLAEKRVENFKALGGTD